MKIGDSRVIFDGEVLGRGRSVECGARQELRISKKLLQFTSPSVRGSAVFRGGGEASEIAPADALARSSRCSDTFPLFSFIHTRLSVAFSRSIS